jgi:uncharacterized membrane protein
VIMLTAGLLIFLGVHMVPTMSDLRTAMVTSLGANGYKIAFTLMSFAGLALIIVGYGQLRASDANVVLWEAPTWAKHVAYALMLPALISIVAAQIPSRIRTALKHPMLVGIKIWALAHLLANGDLASVLLFGSFLAYAIYDRISLKRRSAMGPLGDKTGGPFNDVIVVGIGVVLYLALMFGGHQWLIGKQLLN